MVMFISITLYN
ncbi:hypothetical protein ECPA42_2454, partial [Escherichia coli PA42]